MAVVRPSYALDPRRFGRAVIACPDFAPTRTNSLGEDLRLFALTFAAGFLFVSILIG
ncbi:MAG: hypothetical protein ABIT68_06680 [Sphingomicrobium sp.]